MNNIPQWVYSSLCVYDKRNPDSPYNYGVDLEELGYDKDEFEIPKKNCSCDNCFYGRTRLANFILDNRKQNSLNKLEKQIDLLLKSETEESLTDWLKQKRKSNNK